MSDNISDCSRPGDWAGDKAPNTRVAPAQPKTGEFVKKWREYIKWKEGKGNNRLSISTKEIKKALEIIARQEAALADKEAECEKRDRQKRMDDQFTSELAAANEVLRLRILKVEGEQAL